ncbi:hypothetical protein Xen7305DRAFT_00037500 [Xenococcus sp. PCC 7305]|uniref:hypothetical protein n=1 Tax=Xenococcus sp. PCC 7305 TaxID=102125 RepID=UPI0002AC24FD|nr:hypothetical protein [Xenococcus sp. PCC 7305]ELS04022.1 hypothetical protein Xen7305DRAFT_00037500 [Xenococcus sp. PCC 7305]
MLNIKMNDLGLISGSLFAISLLLGIVGTAKANPNPTQHLLAEPLYLSQSLGHQEYKGKPQMSWDDYELGKVVGHYGGTASVSLEDGTILRCSSSVGAIGDHVLVVEEDGEKVVLDSARPAWVGTLINDYEFNLEKDRR